jgi:Secretion system C-terminal sorting domain
MKFAQLTKTLLVLLLLAPLTANAQKDSRETQTQLSYEIQKAGPQTGDINSKVDRFKVEQISSQLRDAKKNGDIQRISYLNQELESVTGNISVKAGPNFNGPPIVGEAMNLPIGGNLDYNSTLISDQGFWATATSTDRITGRIWVSGLQNNSAGSDTLKVFTSADNGISWTLVYILSFTVNGVHFNSDEVDIEAVNNGTTSYSFTVAGLNYGATDYSLILRTNSTGGETFNSYLLNSSAQIKHNYPRITSDNSKYTSGSFVYFIFTQDSLTAGTHDLKTKYGLLMSPFDATPLITYRNFSAPSGSFWWHLPTALDTTKLYNDIVFSDSATYDIIMTASNFYKASINNIYLAYTKDYGATTPTWFPQIVEANVNYKPRLASTGFDDVSLQQFIMLTYTRQFSATDWDPYYQRTSNNGSVWTSGYVDASTDTTFYSDVIAIPRVPNTFRFAYGVKTGPYGNVYSRSYNNGVLSSRFQLNPSIVAGAYTPIRAGYRYSATDSCFNVVEGNGGGGLYAYSGCSGSLVGIGNSQTPVSFKLSQNYPNPFNPTTKISYALPKSGLVTLRVYDILGKEVSVLVNEVKNAGNYSLDFNAAGLTSGIYFYKLESNGISDIKKMMLIK